MRVCVGITRKRGSSLGRDAHLNGADRRVVVGRCDVRHRAEVGAGVCGGLCGFAGCACVGSRVCLLRLHDTRASIQLHVWTNSQHSDFRPMNIPTPLTTQSLGWLTSWYLPRMDGWMAHAHPRTHPPTHRHAHPPTHRSPSGVVCVCVCVGGWGGGGGGGGYWLSRLCSG